MKTRKIWIVTLAVCIALVSLVAYSAVKCTVKTIADMRCIDDQTRFVLEGYIVEDLGDCMYLFKDSTGQTEVSIPTKVWGKRQMDSARKVRIRGLANRYESTWQVDVKSMRNLGCKKEICPFDD